ncbi:MAG TPA: NAD(P)H-binding protein [Flavobacterium sp.]|uniref:NAD(P)H-binding protein n=1 Tax=Flavobacterium sp. TaxID=239 RepID=UPI002C01FEB0|nr:NAD(P)H-binding protein [Flavobacterium sp.]HNP31810.1 NAD(P)H-binding protein [Flavobacterium sp.]
MKQISILGCGWLGLPLAKSLIEKGFSVKGSTTSLEKISVLENAGIDAFQIEIGENKIKGDIVSFLKNSEILIIDFPPKLRGNSNENFVKKIQNLILYIEKSNVEKVIFTSSTSFYADGTSTALSVTESTKPNPDTESGKQLLEAEILLQNNTNFKTTIIRFGGLIAEDRHPVYHLAGKQGLENSEAPINLIHLTDCIGIIEKIIEIDIWNNTFNAVAPFHPTRKEYYGQKAMELGLPLPEFAEVTTSFGKTIFSNYLEETLDYKFQKPNL